MESTTDIAKLFSELGLGSALAFVVATILFFVLRWLMKWQDSMQKRSDVREDKLMDIIDKHSKALDVLATDQKTAHSEQRREHEELSSKLQLLLTNKKG